MCNHWSLMKTLNHLELLICRGQTAAEESVCEKQIVIHIHMSVLRNCLHDFMDFEKVSVDTAHSKYKVRILNDTFTVILTNRCIYLTNYFTSGGYMDIFNSLHSPKFLHKLVTATDKHTLLNHIFVMVNNFSPAA